MIVAVSDVHMGYYCSDKYQFTQFLNDVVDTEEVEHFVLAGDIFDMWRRDPLKVVLDNIDIFEKLAFLQDRKKIHFVIGNHDYHMIELKRYFWEQFNLDISMDVTLQCGNYDYYFIHGHQFEFANNLGIYQKFADLLCLGDDKIGSTADELWNLYRVWFSLLGRIKVRFKVDLKKALKPPGERLSSEDIANIKEEALSLRKEFEDQIGYKFIVYGHTHMPFVDEDNRLANTGSWVDDPDLPVVKRNTYITIEKGKPPELKEYYP